jgi:hypothetical protein
MNAITPALVRRYVERLGGKVPVIALRTPPGWQGGARLRLADGEAEVAECRSPLEVRERLTRHDASQSRLVILTAVPEAELGEDVLARLAGRRLHSVEPWDLVRDLFALRRIDPRLDQPWLATALLERAPAGGHLPLATGVLDRETAWKIVLGTWFGIDSARPDALALLRWSHGEANAARYAGAPEELRGGLREWVMETVGPVGRIVIDCLAAGTGGDALPLGIACSVVFAGGSEDAVARAQAAVRLERYTNGTSMTSDVGRQFAEVARQEVMDLLAHGGLRAALPWLDRADAIITEIGAAGCAHASGLARCGFEARLARYAARCQAAIAGGAGAELGEAADAVRGHVLAAHDLDRADRVAMATRLCRWLHGDGATRDAGSLSDAAVRYAREGGFVDWARAALRGGEPAPQLSAAYEELGAAVGEASERHNRRFAQLLGGWAASGGEGEGLLPIEGVLGRVVAPLAAKVPVLVAVLDGMSAAVSSELLGDLVRRGWLPLREPGVPRASACPSTVPVVAAFPTVTEICRASLLCGTVTQGVSGDEKRGFVSALRQVSGARHPAVLFHKGELVDAAGGALAAEVRAAIAAPETRVVGVVLNAVDDYLCRSDQVRIRWTLDSLPLLQALLHEAQSAGRIVVLTSDHGHVLERNSTLRRADLGDRYRSADGSEQDDEVVLRGSRVVSPGKAIIAAWGERVRFGGKKNGYHGGAAMAEVIVPLAVLTPAGGETGDWEEASLDHPTWWEEAFDIPIAAPKPVRRAPRGRPQGELFTPEPAAAPDWIVGLLRSPLLSDRKQRAGRLAVSDDRLQAVLLALAARGGRMPRVALAQQLGVAPLRLTGILAGVRELLNVDGYPVLTVDAASDSVALDRDLLHVQFGLG